MTKEEKLQEAKRLYKTANADQRYVLESLFPELVESEDERIKKALMRFHKSTIDVDGIKGDNIIAWLEKQAPKPKWSEEDEKNWCGIIDEIEANKSTAPIHDIETYDRFLSWMDNIKQRMGGEE